MQENLAQKALGNHACFSHPTFIARESLWTKQFIDQMQQALVKDDVWPVRCFRRLEREKVREEKKTLEEG
jgi:hypothetical protein